MTELIGRKNFGAVRCHPHSPEWTLTWSIRGFSRVSTMLSLSSSRTNCSDDCLTRITLSPASVSGSSVSQRYVEPDVNVMRERRERPTAVRNMVESRSPKPEVETDREAGCNQCVITVEEVRHDDHLENRSLKSTAAGVARTG